MKHRYGLKIDRILTLCLSIKIEGLTQAVRKDYETAES